MSVEYTLSWVDSAESLAAACADLASAEVLALDTEFFRESSFYPVPALLQITAGTCVYLIDPQAVAADEAIRSLLGSGPLKLIHASSEDIEVIATWADVSLAPLVDTQVAEALIGGDANMSYRRVVMERCGVDLPKEETRSNWLERPLSAAQLDYAALDVVFLLPIWEQQRTSLISLERLEWLEEDCDALSAGRQAASPEHYYLRQRQLWRLEPRQIEAYRRLVNWREQRVRERNIPRGWLIKDAQLFAIAAAMPKNRYELAAVDGMTPVLVKREGDALLAETKVAYETQAENLPTALPVPTTAAFKKRLKALKGVVQAQAESLGMAPERLSNRSEMEAVVSAHLNQTALPLLDGWRGRLINAHWQRVLAEQEAT